MHILPNGNTRKLWASRVLIGIVVFFNLQCSLAFLINPGAYAPSFELNEPPGVLFIQGIGLLFLMWNIPYIVALLNPQKHYISLVEAVTMQAIGVIGESILLIGVPMQLRILHSSIIRFILFDGSGLLLLLAALRFARKK